MRTLFLAFAVALVAMMPASGQRSPYVPLPWNYPGLLPRFGEQEGDNSAVSSTTTTTTTSRPPLRPSRPSGGGGGEDLGTRIGSRPSRINPDRAPCVDCLVYITKSGEVLRIARDRSPVDDNRFS